MLRGFKLQMLSTCLQVNLSLMQVCAKMQLHFASVKDNQFSGPKKLREMKLLSFNKEDLN